jgi:hypothetical protein
MDEQHIGLHKPHLVGGLAGLVLIAGLVTVLASGRVDGSMVIIAGLASLVMAGWCGWMIWARGVGFCPECGMRITGLFMKDNSARRCKGCGGYVESKGGRLSLASDEAVADLPTFRAGCPPTIEWPPGCCVCGEPATRTVEVQLKERQDGPLAGDVAVRAATLGTMKLSQESTQVVPVPHCDEHGNGAELVRAADEDGAGLDLLFRSNAYCQAFRKLNQHNA